MLANKRSFLVYPLKYEDVKDNRITFESFP